MTTLENPDAAAGSGNDTADRILTAAEALFAEAGFNAVSMNAIAERAGVSKANIFHHFSSKNALYLAVLKAACEESRTHIERLGSESGTFVERFRGFALSHLKNILEHAQLSRLISRDLLEKGPQRGKEFAEQVFGQNFARVVEILRSGQARGELRPDVDPAMVATLVIAANVFFFQSRDVLRHLPGVGFTEAPEQYNRMLVDIMLHGILPPPQG